VLPLLLLPVVLLPVVLQLMLLALLLMVSQEAHKPAAAVSHGYAVPCLPSPHLCPGNHVVLLRQDIHQLALAFITPLCA
jgi:hypothetical protein